MIGKNNTKVSVVRVGNTNGLLLIEGIGTRNGSGRTTLTSVGRFDHLHREIRANCSGLFDKFLPFPLWQD